MTVFDRTQEGSENKLRKGEGGYGLNGRSG